MYSYEILPSLQRILSKLLKKGQAVIRASSEKNRGGPNLF